MLLLVPNIPLLGQQVWKVLMIFLPVYLGIAIKWMIFSSKYLSTSLAELLVFLFFEPAAIKPNNLDFLARVSFSSYGVVLLLSSSH